MVGWMGHVQMPKTSVPRPDASYGEGMRVAPLSVLAQWRGGGVGSALMREAFRRARAMGWVEAFLCGDPAYYHRFGFRSVTDCGISMLRDVPPQFVMAAELEPGALEGITGTIDFC